MLIYNIFDFNDEHHSFDYYDASACFNPDDKKTFVLTFANRESVYTKVTFI